MQKQSGFRQIIKENVKENVQSFKNIPNEEILIERMTGITNETYKVSAKDKGVKPIIYRQFGESETNIYLDRQHEKIIYEHVSQIGLGPKIYCYIGQHTRIQEFIQSDVLQSKEMLKDGFIEHVAYTLRKFHSIKDSKIEKKKSTWQIFFQQGQKIMKICQDKLDKSQIYDQHQKPFVQLFKKWVCPQQIQFLKVALKQLQDEPLVFAHNDLHCNNILIAKEQRKFIFIDYEYCSFNFAICDIANYFNQTQYDYNHDEQPYFRRNQSPENIDQLRHKFIECYCLADGVSHSYFMNRLKSQQQKEIVKEKVQKLLSQFHLGSMLSNLSYGWWSIIVSKNPNIKFDYLQFCKVRLQNYNKVKYGGFWKTKC